MGRVVPTAVVVVLVVGYLVVSRGGGSSATDQPPASIAPTPSRAPPSDAVPDARATVRRRIAASDTYLGVMLQTGDSTVRRWPNRIDRPITVYLPDVDVAGYTTEHGRAAERALHRWQTGSPIPVVFDQVRDSTRAEVQVRWIERFADVQRTGQAEVVWDAEGWIRRGTLTLATHSPEGWQLTPEATYAIALHEIGHLLGLGHSDDPDDLMYPTTSARDLSSRDNRTAALLYALPPGSVRGP